MDQIKSKNFYNMKKALIGFSGLIGKNLKDQTNFQYKFNTNLIQFNIFNLICFWTDMFDLVVGRIFLIWFLDGYC